MPTDSSKSCAFCGRPETSRPPGNPLVQATLYSSGIGTLHHGPRKKNFVMMRSEGEYDFLNGQESRELLCCFDRIGC